MHYLKDTTGTIKPIGQTDHTKQVPIPYLMQKTALPSWQKHFLTVSRVINFTFKQRVHYLSHCAICTCLIYDFYCSIVLGANCRQTNCLSNLHPQQQQCNNSGVLVPFAIYCKLLKQQFVQQMCSIRNIVFLILLKICIY